MGVGQLATVAWVHTRKGRWKFKRDRRTYFTCFVTGFISNKARKSLRVLVKFQSPGSYKQGIAAKLKSPLHWSLSTAQWKQHARGHARSWPLIANRVELVESNIMHTWSKQLLSALYRFGPLALDSSIVGTGQLWFLVISWYQQWYPPSRHCCSVMLSVDIHQQNFKGKPFYENIHLTWTRLWKTMQVLALCSLYACNWCEQIMIMIMITVWLN